MNKKWEFYEKNENIIEQIVTKFGISEILAKILLNRNIIEDEEIKVFLNPTRYDFYNPFLLPDMEKAVDRIIKAINDKEKVVIYGDYDVDGITSVTVLTKFLKERGLETGYYIPNRLEEGYGLNREAINKIINEKYSLMITVDCGISAIEEIKECNDLGIETIVTDHHEQGEILPPAFAVIDAKRKDNIYPFRELAGVGVVFKLIQAISQKLELNNVDYLKYLDIVAIGTISDIVPLIDENRVITKLGLKLVKCTKNLGLKVLLKSIGYNKIDSVSIAFGVAPRINACGRMGDADVAIKLFLCDNLEQADILVSKMQAYNIQRQNEEKKIYEEALNQIESNSLENQDAFILCGQNWHTGVIGIVSSKITEKFYKPSILIGFNNNDQIGKGSRKKYQRI